MKDLLEVIEEGREEFRRNWEGANLQSEAISTLQMNEMVTDITSHTKVILTNQIERMKGEQNKTYRHEGWSNASQHQVGFNEALQTQIDYLEEVINKL